MAQTWATKRQSLTLHQQNLRAETVERAARALEGIDNVEGSDSLAVGQIESISMAKYIGKGDNYRLACSV
jgi:hypothetical protein